MKQNIKKNNKSLLNQENKVFFRALETVVDCVAEAFGSNCEVVLHSLEDLSHSVVKIANGHVTGRKVGSPMTDFGMEILKEAESSEKDVVGSHYNELDDGTPLKSASMLVRNAQGKPIGMICINIDLSVPLLDFIRELLPKGGEPSQKIVEHFPSTLDELVTEGSVDATDLIDAFGEPFAYQSKARKLMPDLPRQTFSLRCVSIDAERRGLDKCLKRAAKPITDIELGNLLLDPRIRDQIAGDLRPREVVERHVFVQRVDDPIAIGRHIVVLVSVVANRVGIAHEVQPVRRHPLAEVW